MSNFEHKGIIYEVRNTDDGAWRWIIQLPNTGKFKREASPNIPQRTVYTSRTEAMKGAQQTIDAILSKFGH